MAPKGWTAAITAGQDQLAKNGLAPADEERQKHLRECAYVSNERLARYATAETYYDGSQESYVTDRLKTYLEVSGIPYNENYCETVVDALVERLALVGLNTGNEALDAWLWMYWWEKVRGDELQLDVHTMTIKKGDAYVILDWDAEKARVNAHVNRPEVMHPYYHEGILEYVSKVWYTDDKSPTNPEGERVRRLNIYHPDRVEKWFTVASDADKAMWAYWLDDGDTEWPLPWTVDGKAGGVPLGIPVYHFANKARGDHMGRPEHLGTIPQQDRLNKELLDLSSVLDQLGWPQRYVTGLLSTADLKNVPGEVWSTDATDGSFGQFDAADPKGLLDAIQTTLVRIATRSNTPAHRFTLEGGYPSGEAMKVAEAGLVAKTKSRHVKFGGTWASLFIGVVALTISRAGGTGESPGVTMDELLKLAVNPAWADPETRNEKEHLETLQLMHALGVSKHTLLTMMPGIDAAQEEKLRGKEDDDDAERAATAMDAGSLVPPRNGSTSPLSIAGGAGGARVG